MSLAYELNSQSYSILDIGSIITLLWQKKIRILLLAAVMIFAGTFYVKQLPKIYVASSTLLLSSSGNQLSLPGSMGPIVGNDDSKMDTYVEFIRSRQFALSVVEALELHRSREFQPAQGISSTSPPDYAADKLLKQLSLSKLSNTDMLKVSFESKSPKVAARVANYIGPAFFTYFSELNRKKADNQSNWLNQQLGELHGQLADSEQKLQTFFEQNQLIDIQSQIELAKTEINALLQQRLQVDRALAESASVIEQIKIADSDISALKRISGIQQHPGMRDIRNRLIMQQQAMAEIEKRYKFKHHRFIAAQAALDALQFEHDVQLQQIVADLVSKWQGLEKRKIELNAQIADAKSQHNQLGKHEIEGSRLRREVDSTQRLYEVFLARLQETEIVKDMDNRDEFAIVDQAAEPKHPSKPRKLLAIALIVIFSGVFSCGFWLILHLISDKRTRLLHILRQMDVNLLGEIPRQAVRSNKKSLSFAASEQKDYVYSEAIRSLRTSVLVRGSNNNNRIIAMTGIHQGEGKSTVSISLAESFSSLEKTLLVDVDMRQPAIADKYDLLEDHPGVSSIISRKAKFSECLYHDPNSALTIMPSGPVPADPIVYLSKPRFAGFMKKLGVVYERLIVEVPAVSDFSDALVISKVVDGIVVVCDIEKTDTDDFIDAIQQLRDAGAPLLGVVFNKVKNVRSRFRKTSPLRSMFRRLLPV